MKELSLSLHLGCSAQERERAQEVRVDVELRFSEPLRAGRTDDLGDTVCYGEMAQALRRHFTGQYKLIERVTEECYRIVKEMSRGAQVSVEVRKVNPPVEKLLGGAFFRCGDFP